MSCRIFHENGKVPIEQQVCNFLKENEIQPEDIFGLTEGSGYFTKFSIKIYYVNKKVEKKE